MSRAHILSEIKRNQPADRELPVIDIPITTSHADWIEALKVRLDILHVTVHEVVDFAAINNILQTQNSDGRMVTTIPELSESVTFIENIKEDAHQLQDVELAIIPAHFGVAENGAMWITDPLIKYRVLPFITQQLAVVVKRENIVFNMHQAYHLIEGTNYDFGVFIAGPSKTADIEQSLVLGAHGPKGMTVFIMA